MTWPWREGVSPSHAPTGAQRVGNGKASQRDENSVHDFKSFNGVAVNAPCGAREGKTPSLRGYFSLMAGLVLCLAGCSGDNGSPTQETIDASAPIEQSAEPVYGGHLRVGYVLEPTSLDAVLGRSGGDAYYWRQIYDQLVDVNHSLEPHLSRSLATSWEISEDPDSITFHLRKGVVFHDGTPFNAEAVKFNVERILDPKTMATPRASMTVIESVDALDEHTVRFNLLRPWGAGINMLADRGGVMNSPSEVLALGADYGWKPSGTGPFRVNKVITGTMVNLVRNEDYWAKDEAGRPLPYLDEVTIRVIRDETVLASALRTGEIDVAYLPYKTWPPSAATRASASKPWTAAAWRCFSPSTSAMRWSRT